MAGYRGNAHRGTQNLPTHAVFIPRKSSRRRAFINPVFQLLNGETTMQLTTAEQQAINYFLQEQWGSFEDAAQDFLTEDELEALAEKLASF